MEGAVEGSLATIAASLAAARVVIVMGADDHFTLQVHVGMSPEELEGPETELSIIVLTACVGMIRVVSGTSTKDKIREITCI